VFDDENFGRSRELLSAPLELRRVAKGILGFMTQDGTGSAHKAKALFFLIKGKED